MTWGRENGDASNCASYPPICTYDGMQQRLRESYLQMSEDNSCTTAPVGVAWKNFRASFPSINLYTADESHPNIYGSYLAACVFYATLYQKSPTGSTYIPSGIGASAALNIQRTASYTVLDSLDLWRIGANNPIADFNHTVDPNNGMVDFTNSSTNGITSEWHFGDGNSSTAQNPSHIYAGGNNTYFVQLIIYATDSCFSDTVNQTVNIAATSLHELNNKKKCTIYPNPANGFIAIKIDFKYTAISIIDLTGKTIKQIANASQIDVSNLTTGVYFIKIIGNENTLMMKCVTQ
jgi:PKD repeat protein